LSNEKNGQNQTGKSQPTEQKKEQIWKKITLGSILALIAAVSLVLSQLDKIIDFYEKRIKSKPPVATVPTSVVHKPPVIIQPEPEAKKAILPKPTPAPIQRDETEMKKYISALNQIVKQKKQLKIQHKEDEMKIKNESEKEQALAKEKGQKTFIKLRTRENEIREELVRLGFSPVDSKRRADLSLELQIVVQKIYDLEVQTPKEIDQIRQNYNNKLERQRQDYEDKIDQLESEEQELKRKISLSEKSRP
jgi:hypothetical protein